MRVADIRTDWPESVEFLSSWIKSWAAWNAPRRGYWTGWFPEAPFYLNYSLILWSVALQCWVLLASGCPSTIQASFHRSSSGLSTGRQSKYSCNHWGSVVDRRGTGSHPAWCSYQSSVGKVDQRCTQRESQKKDWPDDDSCPDEKVIR